MAADEDETKSTDTSATGTGGKPAQDRRARERRQRPPVTIDLAASDSQKAVREEKPEPPKATAAAEPPRPAADQPSALPPGPGARLAGGAEALRGAAARAFAADDGWQRNMLAGVAGGVVALIVVIVLQAVGLLPAPGRSAANQAAEQAKAASEMAVGLERRLGAVEAMTEGLPAIRTEIKAVADRIEALEAAQGTLATRIDVQTVASGVATLRQQVDNAPAAATRDDLKGLTERIARLEVTSAAGGGAAGDSSGAIASLASQLAAAEASLRSLTDRLAAAEARMTSAAGAVAGGEGGAVKAIAVAALRRAAEGDKPFAGDVDMVSALGVAADDIARLRPIAEKGVPATASLAAEFPNVADAVLAATAASDPNAGFFQRILNGLGGLVSIRPTGPIAGSDPPAVVSRMAAAVATGDLVAALAEREALPLAGKDASAAWAAKAADRVALDALIERIARSLDAAKT